MASTALQQLDTRGPWAQHTYTAMTEDNPLGAHVHPTFALPGHISGGQAVKGYARLSIEKKDVLCLLLEAGIGQPRKQLDARALL